MRSDPLPWSDPRSNPLRDIQQAVSRWRDAFGTFPLISGQPLEHYMTSLATEPLTATATPEITVDIVSVDPRTAELWLGLNAHNRPIRQRVVQGYASDMVNDRWRLTGEAVKFDTNGNLIDGQHRLAAIIESGATVQMTVVYNLPPETQRVLDSGVGRSVADSLALTGHTSANMLSAAARLAVLWETGRFTSESLRTSVTRTQIQEYVEAHPDIVTAVHLARALTTRSDLRPSVMAFCIYLTNQVDPEATTVFFSRLADGVGLEAGSAILALRNRLSDARRGKERLESQALTSMTLRAWNYWREGRSTRHILAASRIGSIPAPQPV